MEEKIRVSFRTENKECEIEKGQNVMDAAELLDIPLDGNCSGAGVCGKCRFRLLEGNGNPLTSQEEKLLTEGEIKAGYRLACMFRPETDMVAEVIAVGSSVSRKASLMSLPDFWKQESGFAEGEYGIAFDIGTTTVVGMLWDLHRQKCIGSLAETNPQGVYGADVISRITYIGRDPENLKLLQTKILDCLNGLLKRLCENEKIDRRRVVRCTVDGNTTMSHIFAGAPVFQLALAPFSPDFVEAKTLNPEEAGVHINPDGSVYLLPNIAGHVGSDITAGVIATDIMHDKRNHLLIDIGTNGEIVLVGNGKALACSTAAGPAFEGASISRGMRAAAGAIETVEISKERVVIGTIDNETPVGICGSGIIDAVGQLVKAGIVGKSGKINKAEKLEKMGFSEEIVGRITMEGTVTAFLLSKDRDGNPICITQKDIREVQLAKAAIYAGIEILLETAGLAAEDLDRISIAGAFGNYIDIDNALNMGLLPHIGRDKIHAIGNAAGAGCSMALLSDNMKTEAELCAAGIEHVELAEIPGFQDKYIAATAF